MIDEKLIPGFDHPVRVAVLCVLAIFRLVAFSFVGDIYDAQAVFASIDDLKCGPIAFVNNITLGGYG